MFNKHATKVGHFSPSSDRKQQKKQSCPEHQQTKIPHNSTDFTASYAEYMSGGKPQGIPISW